MSDDWERLARRRITFVCDARQRLAALDACLLSLEQDPEDQAALQEALQALHTLKGNAGFVELRAFETAAHSLEALLASSPSEFPRVLLRRGLDALCGMVAVLAEMLDQPPPAVPVIEALRAIDLDGQTALPGAHPLASVHQPSTPAHVSASVGQLDRLLALAQDLADRHGELTRTSDGTSDLVLQRQRRLLRELRATALQVRLLPIGRAFDGLDRLVQDLAEHLGRRASLAVEGADTEVDRSVLEPMRDLVVHLVRNALAHGIEPPEERVDAGKPAVGTIRLAVRPERNGVLLEVSDDGRGLDRNQVAARAVSLGLCSEQDAAQMPDGQLWALLTQAGFSTHDRIDQVAGRGIGLAAVRSGVEGMRGRIEIASSPGAGTAVRLWLPSMLALDEVVLLRVGAERYAVPQAAVVRVCHEEKPDDLEVLDLGARLQVPGDSVSSERVLVVCQRVAGRIGLLADGVVGRDERLVRPLPRRARQPELLGAIVADGGEVVLVLEVEQF
jgi:two-component system chemotaxis sensor kinase CheA